MAAQESNEMGMVGLERTAVMQSSTDGPPPAVKEKSFNMSRTKEYDD
jgi:hypothetical protein